MATQNDEIAGLQESYLERRDMLLKLVAPADIRKAWFALSHLLLDEGSRVIDMGCDDGAVTYAMAAMAPKIKFTGLDKSKRQINKAREKYSLHNLEYVIADATSEIFEPESVDAIINSYVLHEVYSGSRYNERIVSDTLRKHFRVLKKGGVMFIRDFARPPQGEFVLMEMPDTPSTGDSLADLSEPDLLMWYSEHARPRSDPGTGGFFLEELPPRFPRTRLFRLPHKWAYEFIMRKDDRAHWELGLPLEFTFFTSRDFIRELSTLGARVQYSGPHWEDEIIDKKFEGKFKLHADDGTMLGHPPTCFVAVAYKMQERKSLYIEERRPSITENSRLKITAMRDDKTGRILDVVSRGMNASEIIPYRLDEEGRLKIFLHDGVARSIANAVPRNGINLDGRGWSGHMIEPVAVDGKILSDMETQDVKNSARFSRDHLGLIPREGAVLIKGPDYYPSPDYIDERIVTYYLNVEPPKSAPIPKNFIGHADRFHARGVVRELDAQQVLNAIAIGMIPNGRLELQILSLFEHLKLKAENWTSKNVPFQVGNITKQKSLHKLMKQYQGQQKRFREVKGTAGQLRAVHSTFVEEGQMRGAVTGLASQDADFVVFDDQTINTAVVLPMAKDIKNDVHAGFFLETTPVPQLHQPGSLTMSAPSFNLPRTVTNLQQAKKFLAEHFGVFPQMVFKIGESYHSHVGVTPQRIHPFGVAVPPDFFSDRKMETMPLYQVMLIRQKIADMNVNLDYRLVAARAYKMLGQDAALDARLRAKPILAQRLGQVNTEWSMPVSYHQSPVIETQKSAPAAPVQAQKPQPFHAAIMTAPPQQQPETPVTVTPLRAPVVPPKEIASEPAPVAQTVEPIEEFEQELDEFLEEQVQHEGLRHDPR
ncbi:MAG: methyltransferase domain-containing protein [Micavibrio sp.]|nr:methyltransferase domain-containing protein [Micavibrio sp.]